MTTLPMLSPETKSLIAKSNQLLLPSDNIERYIARVRQIPVLEADEELRLAEALYHHDSIEAAQALIIHHLKFVVYIARSFVGYGLPLCDLIQEGNIGLMKAVKRFEPSRGVRLVSFAVHWIKSEIHEYVIRNVRMAKIATTKAQRKLFFNIRSLKKNIGWLNDEEARHIAQELNVSVKDVYEMESRIHGQDIAFDLQSDDEDAPYSPAMWLADESLDPAEAAEQAQLSALYQNRLHKGLNQLDSRSREIVQSRWLNEDNKATLQTLADKFKVSPERIRQIEAQALLQLKSSLSGQN